MASAIYPKWKEHMLNVCMGSTAKIVSPVIKAHLIDQADEAYNSADEFLSDVTGAGIVSSQTLSSPTFVSGLFDAADGAFSSVTGDPSEVIIITVEPSSGATSANTRLVAYIDGLSVTPNGGNINVSWNASGIFQL